MAAYYKGQPTFSGGELSPSLQARVDLERYATGVKLAKNMIIHPQGGASNRPGFVYVATPKYEDKKCILSGFEFSSTQSYMIEIGHLYARFHTKGGQIQADPDVYDDYNPAPGWAVEDWCKLGLYRVLNCGSSKYLTVSSPYGDSHTTVQIAMASNAGDSISAVYAAGTLSIGLANTTPAKNAANLIQAAVRAADAIFAGWYVTENAAYAAARPTTGINIAAATVTTKNKCYVSKTLQAPSATNTGLFPEDPDYGAANWEQKDVFEVVLPYDATYGDGDLKELRFTQSADTLYIVHPDFAPRTLTRLEHSLWVLDTIDFVNGPFMPENIDAAHTLASSTINKGTSSTLTSTVDIFDNKHIGALFMVSHDLPSQTVSGSLASNASSSTIIGMGGWRLITHGTWSGKITVEKSIDGGSNWVEVRMFSSSSDFNVNTFGADSNDDAAAIYRLTMSGYVSGTCNYDLTIDACTVDGIVKITAVANPKSATATVLRQLAKTTATMTWSEGSWSDMRGWPSAVSFFEDRLAFAATDTEPQTSWFSRTGSYVDFGIGDPLADDDSISVSLPSRKLNRIQSMVPLKELLVLTSGNEATIGSGSGDPIAPTTITQRIHGGRGANNVEPVIIGNRAVFVQPTGGVVRDIGFDYASDGYDGDDISLMASHLFKGHRIIDLAYQQEPDSLIWALREDGVLLSGTYLREQQVLAWSQHQSNLFTLDYVSLHESIAVIRGEGYDQLWTVVKRGAMRSIEAMAPRNSDASIYSQCFVDRAFTVAGTQILDVRTENTGASLYFKFPVGHGFEVNDVFGVWGVFGMPEVNWRKYKVSFLYPDGQGIIAYDETGNWVRSDGWGTYESGGWAVVPTDTISGLSAIENFELSVLADGKYYLKQKVVGGTITLPETAYFITAGVPYYSDLASLKPEIVQQDGSIQGRKVRCSHVVTRLLKTRDGLLGPDVDHLYDIDMRSLSTLEDPLALVSGDVKSTITGDWDNGGQVYYRQDKPLPVTILAFIPAVTVGG
jgi:hypothetical protein